MLITCSECGKQVSDKAASCPRCGNPIANVDAGHQRQSSLNRQDQFFARIERIERERHEREVSKSNKSRLAYVLLGLCLGFLGIHNFYVGRGGRGVMQLVLFVLSLILTSIVIGFAGLIILAIWILVNICSIDTDGDGRQLS